MNIKLNNGSINYKFLNEDSKDNSTILIFLHEGLGSIKQWKDFPIELCLKSGLKGIVYDRFGYGESDILNTEIYINYLHNEAKIFLPELLEKLNINEKVILIGHSDGGSIALIYASLFPDKVKSIITEAAHIFVEDITLKGIKEAVKVYESGKLKSSLERYHGDKTDLCFYNWSNIWLKEDFKNWTIENLLKDIKVKSLIIQGENDEYATLKQVKVIKEILDDLAEIVILENCRHIPHHQQKEFVLEKMNAFIKKTK
ncbi:MAG: alpha/beta fold hydrolase [Candidatus Sericytochromatia bacterium]